jgi:hypothetical protein
MSVSFFIQYSRLSEYQQFSKIFRLSPDQPGLTPPDIYAVCESKKKAGFSTRLSKAHQFSYSI